MASFALWLQELPGIPDKVTDQGLVAVLFVLLIFLGFGLLLARLLAKAVAPLVASVNLLTAALGSVRTELEALKGKVAHLETELQGLRTQLHDRITPAINGLTIAWLRRVSLDELAERLARENPDAVLPPDPRRPPVRSE